MATEYLIRLGHRKIAFISNFLETPFHPAMRFRYLGYCDALEKAGIACNPAYFMESDRGRIAGKQMARALLQRENPPTAIFAASDTHAIGVLDAARELDIQVPKELSVIGYDDIPDAQYSDLTTVDQSLYESGEMGTQTLLDLLGDPRKPPSVQQVALQVVERKTTAALAC